MRILKGKLHVATQGQLMKEVHSIKRWDVTPYTELRLKERNIPTEDVLTVCREGDLVEYHNDKGTRRVLLRDINGTCAVLDLDKHSIVTAYSNDTDNNHPHLQRDKYLFG